MKHNRTNDERAREIMQYLHNESMLYSELLKALQDKDLVHTKDIDKLATFIMDNVEGEPSQDEGAIDCAIRIMKKSK